MSECPEQAGINKQGQKEGMGRRKGNRGIERATGGAREGEQEKEKGEQ